MQSSLFYKVIFVRFYYKKNFFCVILFERVYILAHISKEPEADIIGLDAETRRPIAVLMENNNNNIKIIDYHIMI